MRHFFRISPRIIKPQNIHLGAGNYGSCRQRDHVQMDSTNSSKRTNISQIQSLSIIYGACQCLFLLSTSRALALLVTATTHLFMGQFHSQELQQFCQQLPQLISTMSLYHTQYATYIGIASFKAHSPSFFSPSSLWKLTFIFGRRVARSDWSNWSKWAASPWCTVSGEMDGRKWSEWCGATASGKKAVKLDAIGPKPCPWWPSAKQVECPSWLCWPVRSETKLLTTDFKAMLLSEQRLSSGKKKPNGVYYRLSQAVLAKMHIPVVMQCNLNSYKIASNGCFFTRASKLQALTFHPRVVTNCITSCFLHVAFGMNWWNLSNCSTESSNA